MTKPATTVDPATARNLITMHACTSGLEAGAVAAAVTGTGVYTANKHWPAFRTRLGVSGKWGLVVSSFVATFAVVSEKRLLNGARNPDEYIALMDPAYRAAQEARQRQLAQEQHQLKLYQRAGNYLFDHPYKMLAVVGVPLVGGIFAYQSANTAITSAQKVMHTRLYGQGAVVLLLLGSMAFHDYMLHHGRFTAAAEPRIKESDIEEL